MLTISQDLKEEVVLDQLEIYKGLEVPEVWFWRGSQFALFHLREQGYESITKSEFLPELYQVALKDSIFNLVGWALGNETQLEATGERWVSLPLYPTYYD